jgi:hypothetical protein
LGLAAVTFFVIHAGRQLLAGTPGNLVWACHVADLCVGLGLLVRKPTLCAAGVLVLIVGVPLWLINLAYGGAFYATSVLTHVGGLTVGLLGLRKTGMPREAWLAAVGIIGVLILAARIFTHPAANINLAFEPWQWSNPWFLLPEIYVVSLLATWAAVLWCVQQGCRLLGSWFVFRARSVWFEWPGGC